jgi:LacI family transcriptional regulator
VLAKVTIKEIAQICGVSLGTVDRALNGRTGINPETRERVLGVAKQLGYRPHLLARSLVTGSTKTIGVIVSNLRNSFFSEIVEVIQRKARASGYHVFLMLNEFYQEEEENSLDRLRALNVDGIIMTPVSRGNAFVAYLRRLATPVITLSNKVSKNWPWVGIDERAAVRDGVRYALSKGYTRVLFVLQSREAGKVQSLYVDEQRAQGYRDSLAEAGLAPEIYSDNVLFKRIEEDPGFLGPRTCIACSCDAVALDALNILKANGVAVPARVGLMGFDNVDELKYITPLLTTISYPFEQMGEAAFDSLMAAIGGRTIGSRTLSHTLIRGETV